MVVTTRAERRATNVAGPTGAALRSGGQMVCEALLREGVEVIFGYPGGQIIPLYHVLPEYPLRHVLVRHEQAAAHAADGYARVSGRPGVCFATSGPGATNLVTGLATAYLDSSPVVAVTGQVPTAMLGRSSFQEVDICSIVQSITKGAFLVTDVAEVGPTIRKAFRLARSGRPGPVLVDLPRDVQVAKGNFFYPETPDGDNLRGRLAGDPGQVAKAAALLRRAQRPLLLVGGGVALSGAAAELRRLAEGARLPVVSTLMGLGAFPGSHPLFFGLLGMHGRTYANRALTECDLLLAVGTRLGDRTTGRAAAFGRQATVVHVDVDPAELGKNVHVDVPVVGDVQAVLQSLRAAGPEGEHDGWLATLAAWREAAVPRSSPPGERLQPPAVIEALYHHSQGRAVVVTDVGQHQMWAAQHYVYDRPRSYISSGGLGTMGFGLPAALGAKFGRPQDEVWCVCGDGGLQMNIQEFATLVQEGTAVKVAVLNNGYLGMVRQWQELFYDRRYSSSTIQGPDFVGVARAYGLPARRVTQWEEVPAALKWASETEGPALVEFVVEPEANVYPMVPPGGTLAEVMEG